LQQNALKKINSELANKVEEIGKIKLELQRRNKDL
jgi:hypothetical protein